MILLIPHNSNFNPDYEVGDFYIVNHENITILHNQEQFTLLSLKECIRAIHDNKKHIGFRDSKLSLFLKNHLQVSIYVRKKVLSQLIEKLIALMK